MDRNKRRGSTIERMRKSFGYEWRTRVMYGYVEGLGQEVDPETELLPAVVGKLHDRPEMLEYRRDDWPDNEWKSDGGLNRPPLAHWLSEDQVAQLPTELSSIIFRELPPYQEPVEFIAGDPEGGNFFEESIRAGALPHWDGVELGLIALRLFTLDRFKNARPEIHMPEVEDPQRAQEWWDHCAHLIALLQDMQADYEAVLAEAAALGTAPGQEEAP